MNIPELFGNPEEEEEFRKAAESDEIEVILDCLETQLIKWMTIEMKIAVMGNPGTGKSSFINAILNVRPGDEGAAEVDVIECIPEELKEYQHPQNHNLKLFDLPGAGTPRFPFKTYAETVNLWQYDFYIIVTSDRFRENDMHFIKEMKAKKKRFFFVRTKVDESIKNKQRFEQISGQAVLEKIRNYCVANLAQCGIENPDVYLISNHYNMLYDFRRLGEDLLKAFPNFKRDSLTLSLNAFSEEMIKEKKKLLKGRILKVALFAAIDIKRSHIRIPGINTEKVAAEIDFYKIQFGVDDVAIAKILSALRTPKAKTRFHDEIKKFKSRSNPENWITEMYEQFKDVGKAYKGIGFLPFINIVVTGGISYYVTILMLEKALSEISREGKAIWKACARDQWDFEHS